MDRTYILHRIYTSENSAEHRDTQLSEMYPDVAGTKGSTSTLPLYTSGRNRLLSVRGQDKQKVVTDLWNKYISSKENIRVNITSAIIFK